MLGTHNSSQTQKGGEAQFSFKEMYLNGFQCLTIPGSRVVLRSVISTAPSEYTLGKGLKFNSWQRIFLLPRPMKRPRR